MQEGLVDACKAANGPGLSFDDVASQVGARTHTYARIHTETHKQKTFTHLSLGLTPPSAACHRGQNRVGAGCGSEEHVQCSWL